jgi:hypothetical protein
VYRIYSLDNQNSRKSCIMTKKALIIGKLERIEDKLDESSYPPEETLKSELIERVKTAEKEISKGKCLDFESMDDFLKSVKKETQNPCRTTGDW